MALVQQIQANNWLYAVVRDLSKIYRALVVGTVMDEITGEPLRAPFRLRVNRADVDVNILRDGIFGIGGEAERVFPQLDSTSYTVDLKITATGYRETSRTVFIPARAAFPLTVPVQLRRTPVRLQGRLVKDVTGHPPVTNGTVTTVGGPTVGEHTIALRTPLRFDHQGATVVRQCQFATSGAAKQLAADASAGAHTITLDNRAGLAVNNILRIGPQINVEYVVIESLDPLPVDPNQPGRVTLKGALNQSFTVNTLVQKVTQTVGGPVRHLTRAADAGDGLILLDGVPSTDAVRIENAASAQVEHHALGALTDAEGFYRLGGIGRLRALALLTEAAAFPPQTPVSWTINYEQPVNVVNFRLKP